MIEASLAVENQHQMMKSIPTISIDDSDELTNNEPLSQKQQQQWSRHPSIISVSSFAASDDASQ